MHHYVDDFALYVEGKHLKHLERTMQLCINKVQKWVKENGFKFSVSKTVCVHFHRQRLYTEPSLHLDGDPILVREEAKFLGITFDSKLTFKNHIVNLKRKCQKALNLLRVVGHTDWGADKNTLLKLYRSLVRSKLDYGSIVYGSAKKHILKLLDPIHHKGLRIALGAFRTSPVKSLYAEAGECSLSDRRQKSSMNYFLKLKSLPQNPCFESISNPPPRELFERSKSDPPFGTRTLGLIEKANLNINKIASQPEKIPPPWEEPNITFDLSLTSLKRENTNELVFRQEFAQMQAKYASKFEAYTDGSKSNEKVASSTYYPAHPNCPDTIRLMDDSSVFNAELEGILSAIKYIKKEKIYKSVIYTDSLSAIQAIQSKIFKNPNIVHIFNLLRKLPPKAHITFAWVPSHVGIPGNEKADELAKATLNEPITEDRQIVWSDLKSKVNMYLHKSWQTSWDEEINNKLHEILPDLTENLNVQGRLTRKEETVLSRLRIGHTWITHAYLLNGEEMPFCVACDSPLTVKHILVECFDFLPTKLKYHNETDLHTLFRKVKTANIMNFLKEIGLYGKI